MSDGASRVVEHRELISKIAPSLFMSQDILQGLFWSHKRNYSIKKLHVADG